VEGRKGDDGNKPDDVEGRKKGDDDALLIPGCIMRLKDSGDRGESGLLNPAVKAGVASAAEDAEEEEEEEEVETAAAAASDDMTAVVVRADPVLRDGGCGMREEQKAI
jgi:hypothetical protein